MKIFDDPHLLELIIKLILYSDDTKERRRKKTKDFPFE
jgi:hypothetical protein